MTSMRRAPGGSATVSAAAAARLSPDDADGAASRRAGALLARGEQRERREDESGASPNAGVHARFMRHGPERVKRTGSAETRPPFERSEDRAMPRKLPGRGRPSQNEA